MFKTKKIVLTAVCVALGVVLPMAFHAIPNAGSVFLPMHIPVLLCGLVCGWPFGLACGLLAPLLSSLLTGMPPMAYLPSMLCELAAYGLIAGILSQALHFKNRALNLYVPLVSAMLIGRVVYGLINALIFRAGQYGLQLWLTASFVTALPGILIQLILIPLLILALRRAKVAA
ncbi:MAG: ECF transporter S component [Clostridia bacterium]